MIITNRILYAMLCDMEWSLAELASRLEGIEQDLYEMGRAPAKSGLKIKGCGAECYDLDKPKPKRGRPKGSKNKK